VAGSDDQDVVEVGGFLDELLLFAVTSSPEKT
jgi:hypothetical protein